MNDKEIKTVITIFYAFVTFVTIGIILSTIYTVVVK